MADSKPTAEQVNAIMASSSTVRVARGAKWLDESFPGWEGRIDMDSLDVGSGVQCICGQVFAEESRSFRDRFNALKERIPLLSRGSLQVHDGFSFAAHTLFTEANSWITTLVGFDSLPMSEGQASGLMTQSPEQRDRSDLLGVMLGFNVGSSYESFHTVPTPEMGWDDPGDSENGQPDYGELTDAWRSLLELRVATGSLSVEPVAV